jgi:hypothetical protein
MQDLSMKGRERKTKSDAVNLYWVVTDDHDEDWFILAPTAQAARRYHTDYEGYSPGDAHAELIMGVVAGQVSGPTPRHSQLADLRKLGFEVLNPDPHGRIVRLAGRTFVEGHLESLVAEASDNAWEARGEGRPLGTKRQREN